MKIFKWKLNEKIVAVIAIICFVVLCLLPLLMIGRYDHPCADDYGYGIDVRNAWRDTHSLVEVVKAAVGRAEHTYETWQGTFNSVFLMALTPAAFGEQYYAAVPYIMLGMLTLSILYLAKVVLHDLLKASYANTCIVAIISLFMMIEGIYTPASAFFWYNAAIHYTFMQAVMFLMVAFVLRCVTADKKAVRIATCVLAVFFAYCVGGGNYLNALISMVLIVSVSLLFTVLYIVNKRSKKTLKEKKYTYFYLSYLPLFVFVVAFIVNVSAPGNAVRGGNFADISPIVAILRSFASGFKYCGKWMSLFTFVFLILALPAIWTSVKKTEFRFRFPLLVLLFSFCLFSASFTSSHYGLGQEGLPRTFNNCKMLYHLLLIVNEVYLIGWLQRILKKSSKEKVKKFGINHGVVFYAIVSLALAGVFLTCGDKEAEYPSYAAAKYMKQGFAVHYHMQYLQRLTILSGPEPVVYLREIAPKLHVLYVDDITTNPNDWRNQHYAVWHGKEQVILVPWDEWTEP